MKNKRSQKAFQIMIDKAIFAAHYKEEDKLNYLSKLSEMI